MQEEKRPITKKEEKQVKEIITTLFDKLGVEAVLEVSFTDESIEVHIDSEESGILIGYRGEVLESLQLVLSLAVSKKLGMFLPVSVEIGDYKKKRIEYLTGYVMELKNRVLERGEEISMPNLKSWERRIVHVLLKDDTDVKTESLGEGRDRTLLIKPKK